MGRTNRVRVGLLLASVVLAACSATASGGWAGLALLVAAVLFVAACADKTPTGTPFEFHEDTGEDTTSSACLSISEWDMGPCLTRIEPDFGPCLGAPLDMGVCLTAPWDVGPCLDPPWDAGPDAADVGPDVDAADAGPDQNIATDIGPCLTVIGPCLDVPADMGPPPDMDGGIGMAPVQEREALLDKHASNLPADVLSKLRKG